MAVEVQPDPQDPEQVVKKWYANLCALQRKDKQLFPHVSCESCGRPRKDHHYEEQKCNLSVVSPRFRNKAYADRVERTEATLLLLEQLAKVQKWTLL